MSDDAGDAGGDAAGGDADDVVARVAALPPLREAIAQARLSAKRALGQNFLLDLNLTRRIARAAGDLAGAGDRTGSGDENGNDDESDDERGGTVIEIGPGPGGLTRALLLEGARRLIAVERDPRAITALAGLKAAAGDRLTLIEGDALTLAVNRLGVPPRHLVANLPYNIATRLILDWLRAGTDFASLTIMVQKEVADRFCAAPGGSDYGRLSVIAQWLAEPTLLFTAPPNAFTPPPKVTSALIRLVPRRVPLWPADRATLEAVTAAAFGQRRKMLRASLRQLGGDALLHEAGIDPTMRAQNLSVEEFCRLACRVKERS